MSDAGPVLPDDPHGYSYEGAGWESPLFPNAPTCLYSLQREAREVTGIRRDGATITHAELTYLAAHEWPQEPEEEP